MQRDDPPELLAAVSDAELAAAIRAGDEAAFKAVFESHYRAMHRRVQRLVGSTHVADELVHDVFLQIWRRRAA